MTGNEIRESFLRYFESQGHTRVASASLIPRGDPTLLFTNAGMVPFKDVFLGVEMRPYVRAASSQKCMRVSGKHNDLETVGRTGRHHTFFEMLGNFSFGDYFKKEAIEFAWEFMTRTVGLPAERLWITVFREDDEAYDLWHGHMSIPADKIVRLDEKDNFWSMGETGPCGPCSEIHIDQGEGIGCGRPTCGVDCDCDRFLELWNLVFMQYNRDHSGTLTPLPRPSVDTGMGLERMCAVLQGHTSNYDTDFLRPLIEAVEELCGQPYADDSPNAVSFRVIADHLRALTFLIGDSILPSNEGRGYVLRRIMRRAARHGKMLGLHEPFLHKLVGNVVAIMEKGYPELHQSRLTIKRVILHEEERFVLTLEQGMRLLEEVMAEQNRKGERHISGETTFKLYDTYGFPLDLVQDIATDAGFTVDEAGFQTAMERQREQARASWKGSGAEGVKEVYRRFLRAEDSFVGYDHLEIETTVLTLLKGEAPVDVAREGEEVDVILEKTPFYGESGGQVGDAGQIWNQDQGLLAEVLDTKKPIPGLHAHKVKVLQGVLRKDQIVQARVSGERRGQTVLNHSATHILHSVLREVLGDHVKQAGSLVAPDRLRFDFTHFSRLTERELERIEEQVNGHVRENVRVETNQMPLDSALSRGAMALFGEKYGQIVRVVQMGDFSLELCGGSHAKATGDIGFFKILQEGGVAAGVRRIEALTGSGAHQFVRREEDLLSEIRDLLKAKPFDEQDKVRRLVERVRELERENREIKERALRSSAEDLFSQVRTLQGVKVLAVQIEESDPKALRTFVDNAKDRLGSGVVVVGSVSDGKVSLVGGVTKDLTNRFHAGNILKEVSALVEGTGGGRPDMAQAGGKNPSRLKEALQKVYEIIEKQGSAS